MILDDVLKHFRQLAEKTERLIEGFKDSRNPEIVNGLRSHSVLLTRWTAWADAIGALLKQRLLCQKTGCDEEIHACDKTACEGCGQFFCGQHLHWGTSYDGDVHGLCGGCQEREEPEL